MLCKLLIVNPQTFREEHNRVFDVVLEEREVGGSEFMEEMGEDLAEGLLGGVAVENVTFLVRLEQSEEVVVDVVDVVEGERGVRERQGEVGGEMGDVEVFEWGGVCGRGELGKGFEGEEFEVGGREVGREGGDVGEEGREKGEESRVGRGVGVDVGEGGLEGEQGRRAEEERKRGGLSRGRGVEEKLRKRAEVHWVTQLSEEFAEHCWRLLYDNTNNIHT